MNAKGQTWKKKYGTNLQLLEVLASERFRENSTDQVKALRDTQKDIQQNPKERKRERGRESALAEGKRVQM